MPIGSNLAVDSSGPQVPRDGVLGLIENFRFDVPAAFLVSLLALPLSIGISIASGFPPFAGVLTAIVGGFVVSPLMGTPVSIKGPAAGLIVIALGAAEELGQGDPVRGYHQALAAIVVASFLQMGMGLLRVGRFIDFFPLSVVRGMLAAIGVLIAIKQAHVMLGAHPQAKTPFGLMAELPASLSRLHPATTLVGILALLVLVLWPRFLRTRASRVPAPLVVVGVALGISLVFGFTVPHETTLFRKSFHLGPELVVPVPSSLRELFRFPDFSAVGSWTSVKYIATFAAVGSLESLLCSKAVDALDPWQRTSRLDRDLAAVGLGNLVAASLGGLPMITEIVRSSANIQNGARTRWSNLFHGVFLLAFVLLVPGLVHHLPLAALAAILIYVGLRLASHDQFAEALRVGRDQFGVLCFTTLVTLATDLLVGVAAGVAFKLAFHLARGVRLSDLFVLSYETEMLEGRQVVRVKGASLFSNYLRLKALIEAAPTGVDVTIDFSGAYCVDHTVLEHLRQKAVDQNASGGIEIVGLEGFTALSPHPTATRQRER